MALFKTLDELRDYIKLPVEINETPMLEAVEEAQDKYLRDVLGEQLLTDLDAWHNMQNQTAVDAYSALLPVVQKPLARLALVIAAPELDVVITDSGIGVVSNSNLTPASKDRVEKFMQSNQNRGLDGLETLLRFLEKNKDDYPEWTNSDAYTLATRNLVNTAVEFSDIHDIGKSRLTFMKYRPAINDVEALKIIPAISEAQYNELITQMKSGTVSANNQKILTPLKKAVVFFAAAENLDKSKYEGTGVEINKAFMQRDIINLTEKATHMLSKVIKIMETTPDDYPLYKESDSYRESTDLRDYKNEEDNTIFVFGG